MSPSLVGNVIDPFLKSHHSLALGFFNWASQQPGFTHTPFIFHSLLKSLSHTNHFTAIHSLLKQAKALNFPILPSLLSSIIASHIARNSAREAFLLFSGVGSLCSEIGGATCNFLLAALALDGCLKSAHRVFDEMAERGVGFCMLGFGVFVWRVCGEDDLEKVVSLLDEVGECGSGINGSVVMHVEKNVCDSVIGTLLHIQGNMKYGLNTRQDLVEMGLRSQLHPRFDGKKYTFL